MATYLKRGDSWRATVRRARRKPISKSFPTKAQAVRWAQDIEAKLDEGIALETATAGTVGDLIAKYRELRDLSRPILDTSNEHYMLRALTRCLGDEPAARLNTDRLVSWAKQRRDEGAGPYTVNMELSKLGTVYKYAGEGLVDAVGHARPKLSYLGLIGGGGKRERRPTRDEFERLVLAAPAWFADVLLFAVATAMRRGEITRLLWVDVDEQRRVILVRDRKHPRRKKGNDELVPLLNGAWDVLERMKVVRGIEARIFPYHEQTLTKLFTQLCRQLGIPDLHFHDLRHEGTSQLFEQGFDIPQVALVTGYKDWKNLRRYTNLTPESLHEHGTRQDTAPRLDSPRTDDRRYKS